MTTAFDVPADSLISAVSKELKENDKINILLNKDYNLLEIIPSFYITPQHYL